MIDIHTHFLPAVDDGSPDLETSLHYLKMVSDYGVTDVITTPHLIQGEYNNSPEYIGQQCQLLRSKIQENRININIHCGMEVYLTGSTNEVMTDINCRLAGGDYVLVETAMNGFPLNLNDVLYQLVVKGFKPVLAHPERYIDIIKNSQKAEDLIYRNVYLQLNAGSFIGYYGKSVAKAAWELFNEGFVHFIASDFHCQSADYPLVQVYELLSDQYGEEAVRQFTHDNPRKILNNESIDYYTKPNVLLNHNSGKSMFSRIFSFFNNE